MSVQGAVNATASVLRAFALIFAVAAALLGLVLYLHFAEDVMIGDLTRDPVAIWDFPLYTGFVSMTGIIFWSGAASVCFLGAGALPTAHASREFLLSSGLLTALLGLDDAFQLHEGVFPLLGVPQLFVLAAYVVLTLVYCLRYLRVVAETEYTLLLLAFAGFGISVALDSLHLPDIDPYLYEDGAKLIGVLAWLVYFFRTVRALLTVPQEAWRHGCAHPSSETLGSPERCA